MIYRLRIWAAGHGPGVEITAAEYTALVAAMQRIYIATDVEEKLGLLLENYLEYERELLDLALQDSLFDSIDGDQRVFREIQTINRRAINLLTAARTYTDQAKHSVARYFGDQSAPNVPALLSAEYDRHLEYRIAEALRNHSQHRSLPVHRLTWSSEWEKLKTPDQRLRFTVIPSIDLEEIRNAGEFKASVLAELQASGKQVFPLTPILRRYVESLVTVHREIRRLLLDQANTDYQTLSSALERARTELREKTTGLVVTAGDDLEHAHERHHISDRHWKRRDFLIRKNRHLSNVSKRYVSAEHPGDAT